MRHKFVVVTVKNS